MNKTLTLIICALAVLGAGIAIFLIRNVKHSVFDTLAPDTTQTVATSTLGMREYQSTAYHFSLLYPNYLKVSTFDEGGGATTITFQNVEKSEGFQIFIVPYEGTQVSEQRFKEDVPSGVRESLKTIVVDGAAGEAFYSTDANLGDTREVWVVHGGFLYELTTHKSLETWLGGIIQTWKFI
jgi:hypothetical protein